MNDDATTRFNPTPAASTKGGKPSARREARRLALQALYQWQLAGHSLHEIEAQFRVDNDFSRIDSVYFREILHGVADDLSTIENAFAPFLDRAVDTLDPVERAILRLSGWELLRRIDIPYRVVINEGIELAKLFGATDGHKFVNGVLDRLAAELRSAELKPSSKARGA